MRNAGAAFPMGNALSLAPLCKGSWIGRRPRLRGCYREKVREKPVVSADNPSVSLSFDISLYTREPEKPAQTLTAPAPQAGTLLSAARTFPRSGELPYTGEARFVLSTAFPVPHAEGAESGAFFFLLRSFFCLSPSSSTKNERMTKRIRIATRAMATYMPGGFCI